MELQELKNQIQLGNFSLAAFKSFYEELNNTYDEFQSLLEEAYENTKDKEYYNLLRYVKGQKSSELIERLKKYGYKLRKNSNIAEAFKNMGYRLLEQARAGRKEDVFYGILRIFISAKENFPIVLTEVFKPYYSEEMFKIFIFSFLAGVIGQEEEQTIQ
ncbi:MAG: hypothetical protein NUV92_10560 [Ignavibacteria bacterium]|jgi:hypothetical protein|nr:hypothetical protein [Ignavibacteria bacterium]MDH7528584.1 hypothetical protein [Ignavibacteria bacterium]NPV11336.1 hypothetical protein [Ignavibacteria bacterium]